MLRDIVENYKSRGGEDTDTIPVECPCCRQIVMCEASPDIMKNRELQRELVLEYCSCVAARNAAKKKKRMEQMDEKLERVIGQNSKVPVSDEVFSNVRELARLVCFGDLLKATVHLNKTEKVVLARGEKEQMNINREKKDISSETV